MKKYNIAFFILSIITLITVIAIFKISETPQESRLRKVDQTYENALYELSSQIDMYAQKYSRLPNVLSDLKARNVYISNDAMQMITEANSTYRIINSNEYELCAEFNTDTSTMYTNADKNNINRHTAGKNCFTFQIEYTKKQPTQTPIEPVGPVFNAPTNTTY